MLNNYLKIALRNFKSDKFYTSINLVGLSFGISVCLIIAIFIQFHAGFDQFHAKSDRIYRVVKNVQEATELQKTGNMQGPLANALYTDIPEVTGAARLRTESKKLVKVNEQVFYENGLVMTDPDFFSLFDFKILQGDVNTFLSEPNSLLLTESIAEKYFGNENPIGQDILFNESEVYTITGILEDPPLQSHLTFSMLTLIPDQMYGFNVMEWNKLSAFYTYILSTENSDPDKIAAKIPSVLKGKLSDKSLEKSTYRLQPLEDIHLKSDLNWELFSEKIFSINYMYLFTIVGLFILIIAVLNYVNLTTARAGRRLKEVGVRKTSGARRRDLFFQFTLEILLLTFIAGGFAVGITEILLPYVNQLMDITLSSSIIWSPVFFVSYITVVLLIGLVAGTYPTMILSSFKPSEIFKPNKSILVGSGLRKTLVVMQFGISMTLILCTFVINNQLDFFQTKQLGLDPDEVVHINFNSEGSKEVADTFMQSLENIPGITSFSASSGVPATDHLRLFIFLTEDAEEPTPIFFNQADQEYLQTMNMKLAAGRNFIDGDIQNDENRILINQTLAKKMGWQDDEALGKLIDSFTVIGVIRDYHFQSLQNEIEPAIIGPISGEPRVVSAKLNSASIMGTMGQIEESWKSIAGPYPFQYSFMDQNFEDLYKAEKRLGILFSFFALITVIIACMGLFGLVAFMASKRTKEIGIRKILGATVTNIVALICKDFILLVSVGFLIAVPISWYTMNQWLANYAYRIDLGLGLFVVAGAAALLIALLTVSWQAIKAALANPVDSLRSE